MNRSLVTAAAAIVFGGAAAAADLPARKAETIYAPPPPSAPSWAGFYAGINGGASWSSSQNVNIVTAPLVPGSTAFGLASLANGSASTSGNVNFAGGGQVGYNWQIGKAIVASAEADIQGVSNSGGTQQGIATGAVVNGVSVLSNVSGSHSVDYLGTVRGRLGYLVTPTLLLYGTGGVAYGGLNGNVNVLQTSNTGYVGLGSVAFSGARVGWVAGGGVEWLFLPDWSAKLEYLYFDLGSLTQSGFVAGNVAPVNTTFAATQASTRFDGQVVRAGANYHFNWGLAPVVSK
jgi:outer membrane immunogenic protein